jgi:monofunctional glycosyltransferase
MNLLHHPDFGRAILSGAAPLVLPAESLCKPASKGAGKKGGPMPALQAPRDATRPVLPRSQRWMAARRAARIASRYAALAVLLFHAAFMASTSLLIAVYRWVDPPVTALMMARRFGDGFTVRPILPMRLDELGRRRRDMLIRIEDWNFYAHNGFDLAAIKGAWILNGRIGRPMYGGSTLSMQTARSLFLVPVKSYFRKYLEAIVTVELELILPKDRILELYLDTAEWGRGIFGIKAASRAHFGAPLSRITDDQYARLVAVLSSPVIHTPYDFGKSRILATRYANLTKRFLAPSPGVSPGPVAADSGNASPEPGASPGVSPEPGPTPVPSPAP